jgi:hypothetical protein
LGFVFTARLTGAGFGFVPGAGSDAVRGLVAALGAVPGFGDFVLAAGLAAGLAGLMPDSFAVSP